MQPPADHTADEAVRADGSISVVPVDDLPTILLEAYAQMDDETLHKLWINRQRWLTREDIAAITGFSQRKIDALIAQRTIPMWRGPDSREWRITQKEWRACEQRLIREGLLPKNLRARPRRRVPA